MKHRKKFVKQLMATGQDRNAAEFMAMLCQGWREPYAQAWERYKRIMQKKRSWWFWEFFQTRPDAPQGGARK